MDVFLQVASRTRRYLFYLFNTIIILTGEETMSRIFVLGDFNADLVLYLDRFPQPGETLNGNDFYQGPGGKGSNQAVAAARLGAEVTFFGCIGNDQFGQMALETWRENGVNIDPLLQMEEAETAVAMIYVDDGGDNMIAVHQGANLRLTPQHIERVAGMIAQADVMMCTLGVPLEVVEQAVQVAQSHDTRTLLNPAPAAKLSDTMLNHVDYLTPNETELATLTGQTSEGDLVSQVRAMLRHDDQMCIVTLGSEGARWITRDDSEQVATYEVEVVDTVGAGDAFNAGLAVALAEGKQIDEALRFANAAAALSVTKVGAVAGMPHRTEVDTFISNVG
jgi:ribokinase